MIYIVEDDVNIRQMESYALKNSGYEVAGFGEGGSFFAACAETVPELVILDLMLPGEDGLTILRRIRADAELKAVPVIIITAKDTELDAVRGLDTGADDYVTKPFGIMEFISRVKAMLRRVPAKEEAASQYICGGIVLDDQKHLVSVDGEPCELTFKEYELLKYLMINAGLVLSREKIMDRVWGINFEGGSRTVDMHIKTLRQKLGETGSMIRTIRNVGYKIEERTLDK
ncbi:response regulator transcription factor [Yeguia hominis]|uniref:Stage 0 sporulation protein A homolog n=1 Tax=Yeguia hominis TaxID=2763662 RepID=A0A926D6Q2_9FIRM|nr:response regulator transcription factor [Yeguia hominis]MBC8532718.1 response regulator transcription factor [Yeguia hominis]